MLKRYVRMTCFSLVTMGVIIFAGNVYSVESGAIVGQPQFDTPATAGQPLINNAAMTANVLAEPSAQLNASSSGANKQRPTSENDKKVEHDVFRDGKGVSK